jgi:hypothetical protein
MNKDSSRWLWFLLGRATSYALLGSLVTTFIGAVGLGSLGALTGYLLDFKGPSYRLAEGMTGLGVQIGADLGMTYGATAGVLIFGLSGLVSPPRRSFLPPRALLTAVCGGQMLALVGVASSFFAFENWRASVTGDALRFCIGEHLSVITLIAPAVMVCGQIVGAFWGYNRLRDEAMRRAASALPNFTL